MDFKLSLAQALESASGVGAAELCGMLETPPNPEMGDFALPCFKLAKSLRKAPPMIAQQLQQNLQAPEFISRVEVAGGYLNFFVDPSYYARTVLQNIRAQGEKYGSSDEGAGRVICIDYSSINIAKPFHIGHLITTVLGHALYNIYNFLGYKSVGINHLGDWGTQFGKLIVAYKNWGDHDTIEQGGINELLKIYVKFHDEAEKDDSLNDEARHWFKKIEDGDGEALALFDWFKTITLREVSRVYDLLGITFDSYAGESFYNDKMDRVIDELKAKNLLSLDNGASVVHFPEELKMPPCLILKADGATLYATRDIAAALYRKDHYDFYKCLYVVAYQQDLHFRQWFKVVEMMGYDWYKDLEHVSFGMVSMEDGAMSTRKGRVVFLEDVLKQAIQKTRAIMDEKSPDLENKDQVAKEVGVGAIVFNALSSGRIKDITFSWDRALNFDGETAPYCQYTYARCCSVLSKAGGAPQGDIDYSVLSDAESQVLIKALGDFPAALRKACAANEPFMVTRQVIEIAKAANKFYFEHRILGEAENIKNARLALLDAAKTVIKTGLGLIGVSAPEKM
jgi:arginyl-tRNA synthetase